MKKAKTTVLVIATTIALISFVGLDEGVSKVPKCEDGCVEDPEWTCVLTYKVGDTVNYLNCDKMNKK